MSRFTANTVSLVQNLLMSRGGFFKRWMDGGKRDLNAECGYPDEINLEKYRVYYDREGIAARVVNIYPEESWAMDPEVFETFKGADTPFEAEWKVMLDEMDVLGSLQRIDEISGIGYFGVLLYVFDDGLTYDQPLYDVGADGKPIPLEKPLKLLQLRTFDQSVVRIIKFDTDKNSSRYAMPVMYAIKVTDPNIPTSTSVPGPAGELEVHWTRILHVADNCKSSVVYGEPRMQNVFNRIMDLRKILSGSGEMFWKGAFPGYNFEVDPTVAESFDFDKETFKKEVADFSDGLQRYLSTIGIKAHSLAPQVADPSKHVEVQLQNIALTKGIPLRVFMGSEQAKLASGQDAITWNKRVRRRQLRYVSPKILRPFVELLIIVGALPKPATLYIFWPDLNTPTEEDKANTALQRMQALATYVGGGVAAMLPPKKAYTSILGMSEEEAEEIIQAATDDLSPEEKSIEDEIKKAQAAIKPNPAGSAAGSKQSSQTSAA